MNKNALPFGILMVIVIAFFIVFWPKNEHIISEKIDPIIPQHSLIVVAAGDTTCNFISNKDDECKDGQVVNLAKKENPKFALVLGDLQYGGGTEKQFQDFFDKTWGSFEDKLKPALGNHEYETKNAQGYFSYFQGIKPYYSFNENSWHLISLDSNYMTDDQLKWLEKDLESNTKPCILAFWHHPRYSSGYHGSNKNVQPFWDLLTKNKATLVLNGHDHHYERFGKLGGIRQFIVGTGGRNLYPYVAIEKNSEFRTSSHFGFLRLSLKTNSYLWEFISTDLGTIDKGEDVCSSQPN